MANPNEPQDLKALVASQPQDLDAHLAALDPVPLLLVYTHLSGDETLLENDVVTLEPPFLAMRRARLKNPADHTILAETFVAMPFLVLTVEAAVLREAALVTAVSESDVADLRGATSTLARSARASPKMRPPASSTALTKRRASSSW